MSQKLLEPNASIAEQLIPQIKNVFPVWFEFRCRIEANHFNAEFVPIHAKNREVKLVICRHAKGLHDMVQLNFRRSAGGQVVCRVRLSGVSILRGAATGGDNQIHTMDAARVGVMFHKVFELMVVSTKNRRNVVYAETVACSVCELPVSQVPQRGVPPT